MSQYNFHIIIPVVLLIGWAGLMLTGCPTQPGKSHDNEPDTTSNAFTWTIDTLGNPQYGSSSLSDVAIVDEDNIWAVGDIATDSGRYNLAKWNGKQWRFEHVLSYASLRSIQYFSANDVWANSTYPQHWDGEKWTLYRLDQPIRPGIIQACWGSSSTNLYFVGNRGTIVHYDGTTFTRLASGTDLDFTDIWGSNDPAQILAAANDLSGATLQTTVVQIEDGSVSPISLVPLTYPLSTVWFLPNRHYYVGGSGLYEKERLSDEFWTNNLYAITRYYVTKIRGTALNDVWAVGAQGEVLHWNGHNWHSFRSATDLGYGAYGAVAVGKQTVVAVGLDDGYAVILHGRRE